MFDRDRWGRLCARALALGLTTALLWSATASASNFGSNTASGGSAAHTCDATTKSQCIADGQNHSVYVNVSGSYATQIRWAMANYNSVAPPINMFEVYPPALDKDVEVLLTNQPGVNALAWTQCNGARR